MKFFLANCASVTLQCLNASMHIPTINRLEDSGGPSSLSNSTIRHAGEQIQPAEGFRYNQSSHWLQKFNYRKPYL